MKFKVGDQVKFLNEPGGGVVSKIISTSMVSVAIEDGFDIPILTSELLKIEKQEHSGELFREDFKVELTHSPAESENEEYDRISSLGKFTNQGIADPGIYLAYHPHDQKWLVTGMLDIYIINNTSTDILFSFFLWNSGKEQYNGIDYGSLLPHSKYLFETISHEQINHWIKGSVQLLFHKEQALQLLAPVSSDFSIKSSRFVQESAYQDAAFLDGKSFLVKLSDIPVLQEPEQEKPVTEPPQVIAQKAVKAREEQLIDKYMTSREEAVVDLHIAEVTDDISELSPHDMLNVQLGHFVACLENAMKNRLRKVTFIHGVGNGTLKEAIIYKMKEYEGLEGQSASLAKFGVGAVDILIYNDH